MKNTLPDISDDAKMLLACTFMVGVQNLAFLMQDSRPADRAKAALDELVEKKVICKERIDGVPKGVNYKMLAFDLQPLKIWFAKNRGRPDLRFQLATRR